MEDPPDIGVVIVFIVAALVLSWLYDILFGTPRNRSYQVQRSYPVLAELASTNLNTVLHDILVRYITLQDFQFHYRVFDEVFQTLHAAMKRSDRYYNRYSSTVQFAGSHYDNLRIIRPDEFDIDIVIGLPLCFDSNQIDPSLSDIVFEAKGPGYVQLKMGKQFQNLPNRDGVDGMINRKPSEWIDEKNYMLRSKFIDWFKGVVRKGLNEMGSFCTVDHRPYIISTSESGPAVTLIIQNSEGFRMDVDLVPSFRFHVDRWPICRGYRCYIIFRKIPFICKKKWWLVVPKPNKATNSAYDMSRSWRVALQEQERELIHNSYNLRQTVRLLKKMRDVLAMTKIASYYIKTLFLWEIDEQREEFWQMDPAYLFKHMVNKFYLALVNRKIPYYWHSNNNLIEHIDNGILTYYSRILKSLVILLEDPERHLEVALYLLTPDEFNDFRRNSRSFRM